MKYYINDEIERLTGEYINSPLTLLTGDNCIISLESFVYGFNHRNEIAKIHTEMLMGKLIDSEDLISGSPVLSHNFTTYKGIEFRDLKVGQILQHFNTKLALTFTSIDIKEAEWYTYHNTKSCYVNGGISKNLAIPRKEGLILKIEVPAGTHFLESSTLNLCTINIDNETIFSADIKLLIKSIEGDVINCVIL